MLAKHLDPNFRRTPSPELGAPVTSVAKSRDLPVHMSLRPARACPAKLAGLVEVAAEDSFNWWIVAKNGKSVTKPVLYASTVRDPASIAASQAGMMANALSSVGQGRLL